MARSSLKTASSGVKDDLQRRHIAEQLRQRYPGLLHALIRKTHSKELAEDVINEAVLIMLRQIDAANLPELKNVAGYVFRTSIKLLRNHRLKIENQASRHAPEDSLEQLQEDPDGADPIELEEMAKDVRRLLYSLVPRDRAILTAAYLEEEEKDKICSDLGLSARQFDKVIHRARERMKALFVDLWSKR